MSFIVMMLFSGAFLQAQSVGLVLSGGGAKGLSHIGVIKALEENNIPIDYICGTSMGSIIGGLYAIGLTPDEMLYLFNSSEFKSWYKGIPEVKYDTYFYREEPKPVFATAQFSRKNKKGEFKWGVDLPTSLVSPYPMDLAITQIFASANAAAGRNFDSLMIPFFCVSADIVKKKEYVSKTGDLGSAIRASMTYPFYFKPIIIDSTLLFDGGFYNNFPWELMVEDYNPDFLIGSKCVRGEETIPEDDNIVGQIETMLTTSTDYLIPKDKGIVIEENVYDYGLMDFDKVNEIAMQGYNEALKYIPELKRRIGREVSEKEIYEKRLEFRKKWLPLNFSGIVIDGDVSKRQKEMIANVLSGGNPDNFTFFTLKRGYYRIVASKSVKTIFPMAEMNADSTFTLKVRANQNSPISLSVGGNISSSQYTQGYVGVNYSKTDRTQWNAGAGLYIGRYYTGGVLEFKHYFSVKPLAFYQLEFLGHGFNYLGVSNKLFTTGADLSNTLKLRETYLSATVGTPLFSNRDMIVKFNISGGYSASDYYTDDIYSIYDIPDRTDYFAGTASFRLERKTADYSMYPTAGVNQSLSVKYIKGLYRHVPGTTSDPEFAKSWSDFSDLRFRLRSESYFQIARFFSLGLNLDVSISPEVNMGNYKSSLMYRSSFAPFPHADNVFIPSYRASTYAGLALIPVFKITGSVYIHTTAGYFQPLRLLVEQANGSYDYSGLFPRGGLLCNAAAVWQSPIGPISMSVSYYDRTRIKWYPQFNIGFLLFKNKFLEN